jgi:3-phosphoshikimate 1-carboxyvinyltransferase
MNIQILPSKIRGVITAPSSKSLSHRALVAASLARGTSRIANILLCDDVKHTMEGLKKLGIRIERKGTSVTIHGTGGLLQPSHKPIHLGSSGTSMRFLTTLSALVPGETVLTGDTRLCERPMGDIMQPLKDQGVTVVSQRGNNCPPLTIRGGTLRGGEVQVGGDVSSQFISALLLVSPMAQNATIIHATNMHSTPYINLTVDIMKQFGVRITRPDRQTFIVKSGQAYKSGRHTIEGDFSSSSYLFAAAAITGSSITVNNLHSHSTQGDAYFLTLLSKMGCTVHMEKNCIHVSGTTSLSSINADLGDHPDIVQSLAVTAAFAKGKTVISNISHLKHKETDRLRSTVLELNAMGILASSDDHSLTIIGGHPKGAIIDTHNDHRMAMSFAVAGLAASGKTLIQHAEVVHKSHPSFFNDLASLGAHIKERI